MTLHPGEIDILMVTGDYPPALTGVGDYAHHVANALASNGSAVRVITTAGQGNSGDESGAARVAVHRSIRGWNFGDLRRILPLLDPGKRSVVNLQYYCPSTYGRRLMINSLPAVLRCARRNVRTVVTMHGFWEQSRLYRWRCLPMLRAAHGVVFVDRRNASLLRVYAGQKVPLCFIPIAGNIPSIPCDSDERTCWRQELGRKGDEIIVAFFGGIARIKGFEYLVHAVERVRNTEKLPVFLLAIGGFRADSVNREYQIGIRNLIAHAERSSWIQVVPDPAPEVVSKLLHAADIAAAPFIAGVSENSGSTLASLEHGLPTITTKGVTQFPEHFGTLVVPAGDVDGLAAAIARLARSEGLRAEMGRHSLEATKRWTWGNIADSTFSFFDNLVGSNVDYSKAKPL
jgi:glycosyltransferase involved in cell wall biosynthesis